MSIFSASFYFRHKGAIMKAYYVVMGIALLLSIYKDISNSAPMPSDMRNRIVGARMMKDGLSPYFYIWKKGDPIRYYDHIDTNANVSLATASPFYHYITAPIADLPQTELNTLWLFVQYLTLAMGCLLAVLASPPSERGKTWPLIFGLAVVFTYTIGWRVHVFGGQNYIFIPFLFMGTYYFFNRGNNVFNILCFSIFAAVLILIRPVAVLFFLPLVFYPLQYFKWGLSIIVLLSAYLVFAFYNPVQKLNWTEYFKSIPVQADNHQKVIRKSEYPSSTSIVPSGSVYLNFEGVSLTAKEGRWIEKADYFGKTTECSNLYIYYNKVTRKWLSSNEMMLVGLIVCCLLLFPLLLSRQKKINPSIQSLFILGFIVYQIFSFCMPITRQQYNAVEFLFPLLMLPLWFKRFYLLPCVLVAVGIYFNIALLPSIPVRHNLGQFFILISLLFMVYRPLITVYFKKPKRQLVG